MSEPEFAPQTASYQDNPADVHRVLLLYSGGLDTSVMLKWIQERYGAEVVTLTVNLGQPGEDYAVIEGTARQIGALGSTGKGNDQVRIEGTIATLAPELKVIAPVREWAMGREEEIAYAREHGLTVQGGTEVVPYSIDDNLWGRSSEGRWIEDLDHAPDEDVFQLVTPPRLAPDEAQRIELEFERGLPVALGGGRMAVGAVGGGGG